MHQPTSEAIERWLDDGGQDLATGETPVARFARQGHRDRGLPDRATVGR